MDVTNAVDAGLVSEPDSTQLEHATREGRVLYSFNVGDFYRLHSSWLQAERSHAGLILVPQQRYSIGEQMRRVIRLLSEVSPAEMRNRVEFLSSWGR